MDTPFPAFHRVRVVIFSICGEIENKLTATSGNAY